MIAIPIYTYYLAFFLFLGLPTIVLLYLVVEHYWFRKRVAASICHRCSYDLTGNESGICPECGTSIP